METLSQFLEDQTNKSHRRYQAISNEIKTVFEGSGDLDLMVKRVNAAQYEKTYHEFFLSLSQRYAYDKANDDMGGFVTCCLVLIKDEFKNYSVKNDALKEAREALLKALIPLLTLK